MLKLSESDGFNLMLALIILALGIISKDLFDIFFVVSGLILVLGNISVGLLIKNIHITSKTEEYDDNTKDRQLFLKSLSGFLEVLLYMLLLSSRQVTLLAGFLVLKSIGNNFGFNSGLNEQNKASLEGIGVNIFRIGVILSFFVSLIASYFFSQSKLFVPINELIGLNTTHKHESE